MRKEAKKRQDVVLSRVEGYHSEGTVGTAGTNNYAYSGFSELSYYNSDRKEKIGNINGKACRVKANGEYNGELAGYGYEVETECNGIMNDTALAEVYTKIIFPHFKFGADMFKMQRDCTLHGRSNAEVITQVMTQQRIRNDYAAWKTMFDVYFPAFLISADCYHTGCGMHVNISNALFGKTEAEQTEAIRKLYYFVNKWYDFSLRLFYRNPDQTDWCGRMDYTEAKTLDLYSASGSHGNCLNLSHFAEGRIELRIVGGQKDFYCFRNTTEAVFWLVKRVKSISWEDLDDLVKVFSGCNQAVFRRLETECYRFLTRDQIETLRAAVKREDIDLER